MVYETIGRSPVDWAGRTAPEIRVIAGADGSILVVPVGSLEQHGWHLPTSTDTILVDAVAHAGAEQAHDSDVPVLLTPPVWTGLSPHHLPFGGTASLDVHTLHAVLAGIADSTLGNGFDAILLLNGHGGNAALVQDAARGIGTAHPDVELLALTYFHLARPFIDEIRDSEIGGIAHGGEMGTSLIMHLRPELVREDRIEGTPNEKPYALESRDLFDTAALTAYRTFDAYSESGAVGAPELATAEKGTEIYDRLGDALAELLVEISERHR